MVFGSQGPAGSRLHATLTAYPGWPLSVVVSFGGHVGFTSTGVTPPSQAATSAFAGEHAMSAGPRQHFSWMWYSTYSPPGARTTRGLCAKGAATSPTFSYGPSGPALTAWTTAELLNHESRPQPARNSDAKRWNAPSPSSYTTEPPQLDVEASRSGGGYATPEPSPPAATASRSRLALVNAGALAYLDVMP